MKIPFQVIGDECVTKCPYVPVIYIGTCMCSHFCMYHVGIDYENYFVECKYDGSENGYMRRRRLRENETDFN